MASVIEHPCEDCGQDVHPMVLDLIALVKGHYRHGRCPQRGR